MIDVLYGKRWDVRQGDCLPWLASLPADCCDLVVTSPPYTDARLYLEDGEDVGIARDPESWVAWMKDVVAECLRVCKGLVAVNADDRTKGWRYGAAPFLLYADLVRSGVCSRHPAVYHRNGIPGSGQDAWRNDWEPVFLFTRGGRLPWSDPTACGHPPVCEPGGSFTARRQDGSRVNHPPKFVGTRRKPSGDREVQNYEPPALANPGNVVSVTVGGGHMGSPLAHDNEAPFPESLVERFVLTFCPVGGLVLDPFAGSGTTVATAVRLGRRGLGCDLRQSQVDLARRRMADVQPPLPGFEPTRLATKEG